MPRLSTPQTFTQLVLLAGPLFVAASRSAQAAPQGVLPTAVKGWHMLAKPALYDGNNLFDLVDGEAEAIKAYRFAGCAYAEYAPAGQAKPALTISVFDMSDPLDAFGCFGSDRMSGNSVPIGSEGVFIAPTGLDFWKGRYVVRSVIFAPTPANKAALFAFARAAAAKIGGMSGPPPLVRLLPPGYQPRSQNYERANVAGHAFLSNAITARYPSYGQGAQLFVAQYGSPSVAQASLQAYRRFEARGTGMEPVKGIGDGGFHVVDRFAKNVIVVHKGRFLIGMHHARDLAAALQLVARTAVKVK